MMALMLMLVGCGVQTNEAGTVEKEASTVSVTGLNQDREPIQVEVPLKPERMVVVDMAALDTIDYLGEGERVVGLPKNSSVDYLKSYIDNPDLVNIGSLKEPDLEGILSTEPDLIIIGARAADFYDQLSQIAPTLFLSNDYEKGVLQSASENITTIASILGKEDDAKELIQDYQARLEGLKPKAEGLSAVIGIVTNGGFNTLGDGSRGSFITKEVGFENLAADVDSTHGNEASLELLVELDPDYLFVIDRDSALAAEGAQLAEQILDNELVHKTKAYREGRIIYLDPAAWYLTEGGARAMGIIMSDVEGALQ